MDYLVIRLFCSFITGVIISQTGSFIQLSTRNILASPSTLGFDGLAVLWYLLFHSIALYSGAYNYEFFWPLILGLPVFISIGFLFSSFLKGKKIERVVLLGLTFNLFVGAIFSLWQFLFLAFNLPFPVELWFGHFRFSSLEALGYLVGTETLIIIGFMLMKNRLKLFSLGPSIYKNWGLEEKSVYRYLYLSISIGTFVVVTLFGAFSFLGLIFPIYARKLWFSSHDLKGEFVFGSVMNGVILMLIDFVCYQWPILGAEIPVGLIVTGLGALSLIILLWSSHKEG